MDPCPKTKLSIASPNIFEKQLVYGLRQSPTYYEYELATMINKVTFCDCGPYTISIKNEDGSSFDGDLFNDDTSSSPDLRFGTFPTDDLEKVGTYKFIYSVGLQNYQQNPGFDQTKPFQIDIINPCDYPNSIEPPKGLHGLVV